MKNKIENIKSNLRFINYVVNRVQFEINPKFEDEPVQLDFDIKKEISFLDDEDNTVLVTLEAIVFPDSEENNYPFSMQLEITGIFQTDRGVTEEESQHLSEVNAIAILFPYLRAMVTTYSSNANVEPLILPPINVLKLVNKDKLH